MQTRKDLLEQRGDLRVIGDELLARVDRTLLRVVDRVADAAWDREPDHDLWQTAAALPGAIIRDETTGHLCGYVAVPRSHIAHGFSDRALCAPDAAFDLRAAREITYARGGADPLTAEADATDAPWRWIDFAFAHAGDLAPMLAGDYSDEVLPQLTYRTWAQVHDDVEALAVALASLPKRTDR